MPEIGERVTFKFGTIGRKYSGLRIIKGKVVWKGRYFFVVKTEKGGYNESIMNVDITLGRAVRLK